ncbi:MAG TPA: hypothetical protein VML54_05815, partial [Candidatus Limnocylindrales bacterium]|nr:hypothetical protein [Candidatus Limnocylindrales bacterium]
KYEARRRAGLLPAAELPTEARCEAGHVVSLDWMSAYPDPAHAERVKARLLVLIGTTCLRCIDQHARDNSAAWIEARSVKAEIRGREEKQKAAAGSAAPSAAAPPRPPSGRESRIGRVVSAAREEPFDGV